MKTVYVALGSNLNDPLNQLKQAVQSLQTFAINFEVSPFYGSKPVGPQDQPDYVNAVAKFETNLTALELLDKLQHIENSQGRVRLRRWGERTLDLDLILYSDEQIQNERLTVPHIEMQLQLNWPIDQWKSIINYDEKFRFQTESNDDQ